MKIKVKYVPSEETLVLNGNRFFTEEQVAEIMKA